MLRARVGGRPPSWVEVGGQAIRKRASGEIVLRPGAVMAARKRVMVVEDDAAIGEMLTLTLSRFYEVRLVNDGGNAMTVAAEFLPDLVLLDVSLPNRDGFSIARGLKGSQELSKVPIIFLTAHDRSLDVVKGIQAGAKHYLTKPFKLEDVVLKVKRLIPP